MYWQKYKEIGNTKEIEGFPNNKEVAPGFGAQRKKESENEELPGEAQNYLQRI